MDNRDIKIRVLDKNVHRPIISRPAFIILIIGIMAIIAVVGIAGFIALKLRIAQQSVEVHPATTGSGSLTEDQKKQLLDQLSNSSASTLTDAQKMDLLEELSKPAVGAKQLTDKEKQEILQSLSAPSE